jgi:hypothetical protein
LSVVFKNRSAGSIVTFSRFSVATNALRLMMYGKYSITVFITAPFDTTGIFGENYFVITKLFDGVLVLFDPYQKAGCFLLVRMFYFVGELFAKLKYE